MSRAKFGRRLTAVSVAVTTAVLVVAGTVTPALATTGPSMTANHGAANIAVDGANNSLMFYWAVNGSPTWNAETVAGAGTTNSPPSIAVIGNDVYITAIGSWPGWPEGLLLYSAANGTSSWDSAILPAVGGVYPVAPAITGIGTTIAVSWVDAEGELKFMSAPTVDSTWNESTVGGDNTTRLAPSMTLINGLVSIAATSEQGQLMFYSPSIGSYTWISETVAGVNSTVSAPSLTADGNGTNISAVGGGSALKFYWATDGTSTWTAETVAGGVGLPLP